MKIAYDFHIHTAASPCADEYMSPNNIVNMAKLNGLQTIAITDHNTCVNCEAVMQIGEQNDLLVIPGMEIECMEEFHCIALFKDIKTAKEIEDYVTSHMPQIKNRVDIFGHQYILNKEDEIIGEIERLLLTASAIPAEHLFKAVRAVGGVIYPAHIDRNSYSIISNLGFIPEELDIHMIELSKYASVYEYAQQYKDFTIIQSSDAHYLQDISQHENFLDTQNLDVNDLFKRFGANRQ
ncbi:PHP domain-containing protein [Cellulosilyticum sp. I15G10I2]|uniref:PHP domain-containing protein n=1 Tax=Cellulosilyticum sp. I15G10I2 TaxID=1892843 RepID=UPI00085C161A|nr:PHP domain-containing protein [Cellulosilyticum sp. I15G10I2]